MKSKNLVFSLLILFGLLSCSKDNNNPGITLENTLITVTDYDRNIYNTVLIGDQLWMKANLRVTHFRNGDRIPTLRTRNEDIFDETAPIYQWPVNLTSPDSIMYGRYYTWYAATDPRCICPQGWHLPDSTEFRELINYLGGTGFAGGKLKETGTTHWKTPNSGANNFSGFSALPTNSMDLFLKPQNELTSFWSSSTAKSNLTGDNFAFNILLQYGSSYTTEMMATKKIGYPLRCIKDN